MLERVEEIAPETRSFFLRLPAGRGLDFQPGQFLSLGLPVVPAPIVRPYSVASDPEQPELLEICLNRVPLGPGSDYLFALVPGAEVDFTGPWGSFVLGAPAPRACVLVAAGPGVVPLRPMIRAALARPEVEELRLVHAAADEAFLLYRADFERWASESERFCFEPLLEGDDGPEHAPLLSLVRQRYVEEENDRRRHFFLCGVGDIVTRLRDLLRGAGYERRAVHYEKW